MVEWIVLLGILLVIIFAEGMREVHTFKVTHYRIRSSKLKNLKRERKVIVLSDLHNYSYGKHNRRLLEAIRTENPDLIFITGDMLVGKAGISPETAERLVGQLPEICETYYANGNHEQRMKENAEAYGTVFVQYKNKLEKKGVHFLENEKVQMEWDGQAVDIFGLEIPADCYTKFQKTELRCDDIISKIGKTDQSKYEILLAHNPAFAQVYMDWGADLILSGHLHGGIVRIPFLGGMISPQAKLFPKYSGEMTVEGERTIVVSKGLGVHTIKFRFLNSAEMIVLHIGGDKN